MTNDTLLKQLGELLSLQADTLRKEMKANKEELKKDLKETIKKSQEDTIEVLSQLFHEGHNLHEKRIKRVEDHLHLPPMQ